MSSCAISLPFSCSVNVRWWAHEHPVLVEREQPLGTQPHGHQLTEGDVVNALDLHDQRSLADGHMNEGLRPGDLYKGDLALDTVTGQADVGRAQSELVGTIRQTCQVHGHVSSLEIGHHDLTALN